MFRLIYLLLTIILLSSNASLFCVEEQETTQRSIEFGIADIQVGAVLDDGKSTITPNIIVKITGQNNHVLSYGMTDVAGTIAMPLPPGRYCYELYSENGEAIQTRRKDKRRCFDIEKDAIEMVGIDFILNEKPQK